MKRIVLASKSRDRRKLFNLANIKFEILETNVRKSEYEGFQKHLIRFRMNDQQLKIDEDFIEIIVVNSHNRTCSLQVYCGIFRLVCSNGLIIAKNQFNNLTIKHINFEYNEIFGAD